jgi:hypothetical protein
MKKIYKYQLKLVPEQELEIPLIHADYIHKLKDQVLKVEVQDDRVCIWVMVDTELRGVTRHIHLINTGDPIKANIDFKDHLGSFMLLDGAYVGHVFGY